MIIILMLCMISSLNAINIAITIDDYPLKSVLFSSLTEQTARYLQAADAQPCHIAFFCVGQHIQEHEDAHACLQRLSDKGHLLANHSFTHSGLSRISLAQFEQEIKQTAELLKPYQTMRQWFRYPYLDYGNRTPHGSEQKMLASLALLTKLEYREGYVSINTFDWHINGQLIRAMKEGKHINYTALKSLYLMLIKEWIEYYINLYRTALGYDITHTLLLHANDLNALYLEDILSMINHTGWHIVEPDEAFTDLSWRNEIVHKRHILAQKPPTLSINAIDSLIKEHAIFT